MWQGRHQIASHQEDYHLMCLVCRGPVLELKHSFDWKGLVEIIAL